MVPVLPGLMCINAWGGFKKMTGFCKTRVPGELLAKMESIKVRFGIEEGGGKLPRPRVAGVRVYLHREIDLDGSSCVFFLSSSWETAVISGLILPSRGNERQERRVLWRLSWSLCLFDARTQGTIIVLASPE